MKKSFCSELNRHRWSAILLLSSSFVILSFVPVYAVSEAALLFLLISPSPQANAMGQTYGNILADDPMAFAFNPASAGLFAQKHFAGTSFYPEKTPWLPIWGYGITYNCHSTGLGLNLKKLNGMPVSFGIGLTHIRLNLGKQHFTGEYGPDPVLSFDSYESANKITLAAVLDYYIQASVGFGYNFIESQLGAFATGVGDYRVTKVTTQAHDWGLILRAPIFDILDKVHGISGESVALVKPFFDVGLSYSLNNIGDKVIYIDEAQADPFPRTVYVGSNLQVGFRYMDEHNSFNLFSFKWAREADDMLVSRESDGSWRYLSGLNDIKFVEDILFVKGNGRAITKKGWEYGIGDFFFIRRGGYEDREGRVVYHTKGWGVNFVQPFRNLSAFQTVASRGVLYKLLWSMDIEYHESSWVTTEWHPLTGTFFKGLVIKLRNFPLEF